MRQHRDSASDRGAGSSSRAVLSRVERVGVRQRGARGGIPVSIESVRSTNILYYHTNENGQGRAEHISKTNEGGYAGAK